VPATFILLPERSWPKQWSIPRTYEAIRKLKGIGDYTSAAIASIAFGFPSPVVDGNVLRLFSRFFGIDEPIDKAKGKIAVFEKANQFINPEHPGDLTRPSWSSCIAMQTGAGL